MITRLNTYEGVPLGAGNFEEYLAYVRSFLGANFGFSTNIMGNDGGFFESDLFVYTSKGAAPQSGIHAFSPSGSVEAGNLFGREGGEFYRFSVLNAVSEIPHVNRWEILATDAAQLGLGSFRFENTSPTAKQLPYRPVRTFDDNVYSYGYYAITLNGIPQTDYSFTFTGSGAQFRTQTIDLNTLSLGAEYPVPIKDGRFDSTGIDREFTYHSLRNNYDSTLTFANTNFGIDNGGHILLYREGGASNRYVYIPQDVSSLPDPEPGTYKVVDAARGIIKLNVTGAQVMQLAHDGEIGFNWETVEFGVVSAEQLQEATVGGVNSFFSRYGGVYTGNTSTANVVSYIYDGQEHIVTQVPEGDLATGAGSTLLRDTSGAYGDSLMLAIYYEAAGIHTEFELSQTSRYSPDTFQLYYSPGIIRIEAPNTSSISAVVEHNPISWYNRDVLDAGYYPVARANQTLYSMLTVAEASNFSDGIFNPDHAFQIVDNIALVNLNDVPSVFTAGQTIVYNGSSFDAVDFALQNLTDVSISHPEGARRVLSFGLTTPITPSTKWEAATVPAVLGYTPVNKGGDTGIGRLTYTTNTSPNPNSSADEWMLVPRNYVDQAIAAITGDIDGGIGMHPGVNAVGVHGSTVNAVASRLVHRDSNRRAYVAAPAYALSTSAPDSTTQPLSSEGVVTTGWMYNNSSASNVNNTLILRNGSGHASVADPTNSSHIANLGSVTSRISTHNSTYNAHGATSASTAGRIILRDSNQQASIGTPSIDSHIANKGYVDSKLGNAGMFGASGNSPFGSGHVLSGNLLIVWASVGGQSYPANTSGGGTGNSDNRWARYTVTDSQLNGKTVTLRSVWVSGFSQSNNKYSVELNQDARAEPGRTGTRAPYVETVTGNANSRRFGASVKAHALWNNSFNAAVFWLATVA